MDAAGRALAAHAHMGPQFGPGGHRNLAPENPHNGWDGMAPFPKSLAFPGNRPPLIAGGSLPRVQSENAIPMRGGVWDMPTFPGDIRVFSNPNPSQLPRSSDNQGGSQERSGEINQTIRTSQDLSGSLDARKGSMSDSPTPEVQVCRWMLAMPGLKVGVPITSISVLVALSTVSSIPDT